MEERTGCAGEIGHITLDMDGPRCNCGNYGCLEAMGSGEGDRLAQEIVERSARYIGTAVAGMINIFNPDMVVVGGRVVERCPDAFDIVKQQAYERAYDAVTQGVTIVRSKLGRNASLIGATASVMEELFTPGLKM